MVQVRPEADFSNEAAFLEIATLSDEESMIKKAAHSVAKDVIRPASIALDRMNAKDRILPESPYFYAISKLRSLGYHRMFLPGQYLDDGDQVSPLAKAIFLEELGWGSLGIATSFGVDVLTFSLVAMFGSDELKAELLDPWISDSEGRFHGCWGATEPSHGSDGIMALRDLGSTNFGKWQVTARADGSDWIISGQKSAWVSSAPIASHCVLHAQNSQSDGPAHGMLFIVDLSSPGVSIGPPIDMLGVRDDPQGEIFFDEVRVPGRCLLVADSPFYPIFVDQLLCTTSVNIANIATGVARACLEEALSYATKRVQGGVAISEHKNIQLTLYSMFEKVETSRSYARQMLRYTDRFTEVEASNSQSNLGFAIGPLAFSSPRHCRSSQIYAKRVAFEVANDALQVIGAMGLSDDSLIQKLFRDARSLWIEDGTLEVLALDAARNLIGNYDKYEYDPQEVAQKW